MFSSMLFQAFLVIAIRCASFISEWVFWLVFWGRKLTLPPISNDLLLQPANVLAVKIREKKVKSKDVINAYITRIKEVQPFINAKAEERFQSALNEAQEVDDLINSGQLTEELIRQKPLLGIPFTVKISFAVKDLPQTTGLYVRKDTIAKEDAEIIRNMKEAGAILLCTTNTAELCMWWESNNTVYGRTNNPYDTTRTPGGSSGGEGALIGAAGSLMGIGSDIGGSIRIPSLFNGIFGHKPTKFTTPINDKVPIADGEMAQYCVTGPMCRYASDLIPFFKVLAKDNLHKLKLDEKVDIKNLKVYYMDSIEETLLITPFSKDMKRPLKKVIGYLEKTFGIQAERCNFSEFKYCSEFWILILKAAEKVPFSQLMADGKGDINVFMELFKWFTNNSVHTLPAITMGILDKLVEATSSTTCDKYKQLFQKFSKDFKEKLGSDGIFLIPTLPEPALHHYQTLTKGGDIGITGMFNLLGVPVTHCPMGLNSKGLPVGIEVVSNLHNDHITIAVANELERAFKGWVAPPSS